MVVANEPAASTEQLLEAAEEMEQKEQPTEESEQTAAEWVADLPAAAGQAQQHLQQAGVVQLPLVVKSTTKVALRLWLMKG